MCGKFLGLREHRPPPARVRKRPDQQMGVLAHSPGIGRVRQLQPVELDFLTRRVSDHRDVAARRGVTRLAVRPDLIPAQSPGERRVPTLVTQTRELVEQRGCPQMRIISQPLAAILQVRDERVRTLTPLPRDLFAVQIGTDRLAITTQMPSDR
ncbi:hypothetical protein [Streptomyces sp. NPDC057910]|uniref:hypothetical protein n=1 Tax=Streptomyces sp. NPDC057910 TaxID=3346278 RepID=UPI0036ED94B1